MLDPNNVQRWKSDYDQSMTTDELGMWVAVRDYWVLKDDWIRQNLLIRNIANLTKGDSQ